MIGSIIAFAILAISLWEATGKWRSGALASQSSRRCETMMSDDYKIYADAGRPATLNKARASRLIAPPCKRLYWPGDGWRPRRKYERPSR